MVSMPGVRPSARLATSAPRCDTSFAAFFFLREQARALFRVELVRCVVYVFSVGRLPIEQELADDDAVKSEGTAGAEEERYALEQIAWICTDPGVTQAPLRGIRGSPASPSSSCTNGEERTLST